MRVVARGEWLDIPRDRIGTVDPPLPRRWLHHGASGTSTVNTARAYARYHMLTRGWSDIGYNFIVAAGKVLEGRGPNLVGAHTRNHNRTSHGIVVAGNYQVQTPAQRDLDALVWLLGHGVGQGWWTRAELTGGHRDAPGHDGNLCPGNNLHRLIPDINRAALQEDDMPLSEDDLANIVKAVWGGVPDSENRWADPSGGDNKFAGTFLRRSRVNEANLKTALDKLGRLPSAEQIADAVVARLPGPSGSGPTRDQIAKAVVDELHTRLSG